MQLICSSQPIPNRALQTTKSAQKILLTSKYWLLVYDINLLRKSQCIKYLIRHRVIKLYYQQNISKFSTPAQVKLQYITLSVDQLAKKMIVTDAEISQYIANHSAQADQRQVDVSHILFQVPANATPEQKQVIKDKALKVLAQVKSSPSQFASLAKQYSQDPGSASNGGDLGFFGHGVMVKPFEKVAFSLKQGQISDLVETQFGFHIIKLNAVKGEDGKYSRDLAITQLQKAKANGQIQKDVEQLNDITYNQPQTLDPAAKKFGLSLYTSEWVSRGATSGAFANQKIQKAIFTQDVIESRNNSTVVDMGDGSYSVYRVVDYKPMTVEPISQVNDQIVEQLKLQKASLMAAQEGQKDIQLLQQGTLKLPFADNQSINLLAQNKNISVQTAKQIFGVSLAKLPAYTGSLNQDNSFVIYKINSETVDPSFMQQNGRVVTQINASNSMLDLSAYVASLRNKYSVNYKLDRLQADKSQQ